MSQNGGNLICCSHIQESVIANDVLQMHIHLLEPQSIYFIQIQSHFEFIINGHVKSMKVQNSHKSQV